MSGAATASVAAMTVTATDAWALAGLALCAAGAICGALRRGLGRRLPAPTLSGLCVGVVTGCLVSALWPALGMGEPALTWAAWLRGITGDPSATTVVLVLAWAAAPRGAVRPSLTTVDLEGLLLRWTVALVGWALLLSHLLSDRIDLYRLGYEGASFPLGLLAIAFAAAFLGAWRMALSLAAALSAWGLGLMESSNLWDAVLDPWLVVWATGSLVWIGVRRLLPGSRH